MTHVINELKEYPKRKNNKKNQNINKKVTIACPANKEKYSLTYVLPNS